MTIDVSEALSVYLGTGSSGGYQPIGNGNERLKATYGNRYSEALAVISKYLSDAPDHPPTEWSSRELAVEFISYEKKLRAAFPELSDHATNALACQWSYSWR